jgi:hypothetical protein
MKNTQARLWPIMRAGSRRRGVVGSTAAGTMPPHLRISVSVILRHLVGL